MIEGIIFLSLLALGLVAGTTIERKHLRDLERREEENGDFLVTQLRSYPWAVRGPKPPTMLCGEAVISSDYLKTFTGGLRKIFGGELRSYRSLMDRARREALQRVIEDARSLGYNAVCNVRFDSCDIAGATGGQKGIVIVTIIASATAYHWQRPGTAA